jgi:N-hydroxyarylamine O-acetyltransferase
MIPKYLARIGVQPPVPVHLPGLTGLMQKHQQHIHFENLDILSGRSIQLDPKSLFQKIIVEKRGGVCFELNGLFHLLLNELGFDVQMIAGTVYESSRGEWGLEGTHLTNLVCLNQEKYLVDVGFGGNAPRRPVPLSGEVVQDIAGQYRIRSNRGHYVLEKKEPGAESWLALYRFTGEAKTFPDFHEACRLIETSPRSPFNRSIYISKMTPDGRVSLIGRKLVQVTPSGKEKREVSENDLPALIREIFQIRWESPEAQ